MSSVSAIRTPPSSVFKVVKSFVPLVFRSFDFPSTTCSKTFFHSISDRALSASEETAIWLTLSNVERRLSFDRRDRILPLPGEISLVKRNFLTGCTKGWGKRGRNDGIKGIVPCVAKWCSIHRLRCDEYNRGPSSRVDEPARTHPPLVDETFNYITR